METDQDGEPLGMSKAVQSKGYKEGAPSRGPGLTERE